jgi:hypothetical protein
MPANAGIQYAVASRFYREAAGILDHPPSRVMTPEYVVTARQPNLALDVSFAD